MTFHSCLYLNIVQNTHRKSVPFVEDDQVVAVLVSAKRVRAVPEAALQSSELARPRTFELIVNGAVERDLTLQLKSNDDRRLIATPIKLITFR